MKHRRAAASYAKALFAVAKERNQTEAVSRELGDMAATFESDLELRNFFTWPWIPVTEKRAVATEVAQQSDLSKLTRDFLALLAERGRADYHNLNRLSTWRIVLRCGDNRSRGGQKEMPKSC